MAAPDPYTRCPDCRFVGPPESIDYALTSDLAGIDWSQPVWVTCGICHAIYRPVADDVLPTDSAMICKRCSAAVPCPAAAARVRCTGCGLLLVGPDLTRAQRTELAVTESLTGLADRARVQAAKDRARSRRPRP